MLDYLNTSVNDEFYFEDDSGTSFRGKILEISFDSLSSTPDDEPIISNLLCIAEIKVSDIITRNDIGGVLDELYAYGILEYNGLEYTDSLELPETLKWDITEVNVWEFNDPTVSIEILK